MRTFLHLYVFYMCETFHCIRTSGLKFTPTSTGAIKSNMAVISVETKHREKKFFMIFHTDHNKL